MEKLIIKNSPEYYMPKEPKLKVSENELNEIIKEICLNTFDSDCNGSYYINSLDLNWYIRKLIKLFQRYDLED